MKRRNLVAMAGVVPARSVWPARAQPARIRCVGWLGANTPAAAGHLFAALRTRLKELGWIEGQNLDIDARRDDQPSIASGRRNRSDRQARAPVVSAARGFAGADDRLCRGRRPGRGRSPRGQVDRRACRRALFEHLAAAVQHACAADRAGGFEARAGHHVSRAVCRGRFGYGASLPDQLRRSAFLADKILKGAKPADIPVEQATLFELVVNLKSAKALGIAIPRSILLRADGVIE